ncbi:MAG: endonuclease III [Parasporobacterium sp.]|nr:endonuclease III [Parasporobacterium sp.]
MTKKERVKNIIELLNQYYSVQKKCWLEYSEPWQLLIATILSAQCTDARVNMVTPELFKKYPDVAAFAAADVRELEQDIHSTGFYHNKARNIIGCCRELLEKHGGEIPSDIDQLTALPGVGRKTANVIRGNIYDIPSIVVDTHVGRISRKLGLTKEEDPTKVEHDLEKVLPKDHWILWNIQIIALGREICTARSPKCHQCFLSPYCPSFKDKK